MPTTASRLFGTTLVLALLAAVGVGTYLFQPREPATPPVVVVAPTQPVPQIAQITNAARSLKLITWSFDTTLDAQSVSDKWYGDATAVVRAPVRYQYGVDLSALTPDDSMFDSVSHRYVFIVPPPLRMSVEVDLEKLEQSLSTSGLRWRSRNAEQLDEARKILGARARELQLSSEDEQRLRDVSREQLELHLTDVLQRVAPEAKVVVRFAD